MSYFATISGVDLSGTRIPGVVFTPAALAQNYLRVLDTKIASLDGEPVYLCDDNATGTSHEIFRSADEAVILRGSLEGSPAGDLLSLCERTGAVLRVWWGGSPESYLHVTPCTTLAEATALLLTQQLPEGWHIRFEPKPILNPSPRV